MTNVTYLHGISRTAYFFLQIAEMSKNYKYMITLKNNILCNVNIPYCNEPNYVIMTMD